VSVEAEPDASIWSTGAGRIGTVKGSNSADRTWSVRLPDGRGGARHRRQGHALRHQGEMTRVSDRRRRARRRPR
jgi:hypothetical protein